MATIEVDLPSGDFVWVNGARRQVVQITPANVAASQTDTSIISAGTATQKIRVLTLNLQIGATATAVTLNSKVGAAASTVISPAWEFGSNGGISITPYPGVGAVKDTDLGGAVTITTGTGATTHVSGTYCLYS